MRDLESREVKEELIEMDLDNEDVVREYMMDADTPLDSPQANPSNMQQIVSAPDPDDDNTWDDAKIDPRYMMLLDSFREDARDNPLRCIRYDVDNGCYDKREFKPVTNATPRSREVRNNTRVNKKNVETKPPVRASTKKRTERDAAALRRRENVKAIHAKRKKETSDEQVVFDEIYRAYLIWLVENAKSSRTNPQKEIQVKREKEDTMSLSDCEDTEIIAVGDRPFLDEEDSPFVASKTYKVVDLEEESYAVGDQRSSWFRKEMTNLLKQPYNDAEYLKLNREASMRKCLSRCRQLRDGREVDYDTDQTRPSYLDEYPDFKQMLSDSLFEKDRHRALNLLRGFTFYLEKVARNDAFKPWLDTECLDITYGRKNSRSPRAIKSEFCTHPSFYGI